MLCLIKHVTLRYKFWNDVQHHDVFHTQSLPHTCNEINIFRTITFQTRTSCKFFAMLLLRLLSMYSKNKNNVCFGFLNACDKSDKAAYVLFYITNIM